MASSRVKTPRALHRDCASPLASSDLLRMLIDQLIVNDPEKEQGRSYETEQILMDADIAGDRYLVVRLPKIQRTPVSLSPREREIVRMVAQGHPNKVIATILNISLWTVCTHLRRIFAKLGVASRAAMVRGCWKRGDPGNRARAAHAPPQTSQDQRQ